MFILPHGVFFKPNENFLKILGSPQYSDVAILEAGAGTGFTLSKIKEFGKKYGINSMANSRGFDIHYRDEYDCQKGEHFRLKSKYGIRFCKLWRIKRLATQNEIFVDSWSGGDD